MGNNKRDLYFTWDIHYECNFRCPYCWFYEGWPQAGRRNIYLAPDEWMVHWNDIYNKYGSIRIEITGGEPFLYPNFIQIVKKLSSIHTVKVTTNMSGDIEAFVREISPEIVNLDLNFHPLFADIETFLRKTLLLKSAGFKIGVCYLAYPPQMKQMNRFRRRFEEAGINFALAAFWGEYQGKRYPDSYTEEEREVIRPFLGDIDRIIYHLKGKSPKGKLCNAGHTYAVVQADGNVVRCGQIADKFIGNIMNKDFHLFEKPVPCEAETCPCNEYINLIEEDNFANRIKTESSILKKSDNHEHEPRVKYRRLGKTQLMVSEVGLGGHEYDIKGGFVRHSLQERTKIISKALDLGINFFDAADRDELFSIVNILRKLNARDKCIVSYGENVEGFRIINADEKQIRELVEGQLKTLQTDRIDIFRILDFSISDYAIKMNVSLEEEIEEISLIINKLKEEGKVRFSCFTTHSQEGIERWAGKADVGNLFDTIQIRFNFLECGPINRIIPYAKAHDMGIIVMKPFRKGTLLNKFCGDSCDSTYSDLKSPSDPAFEHLKYKEKGLVYALLKYVLSHQDISTVIPGVASVEQLEENANVSILD
jgi:aryl-alcohol dehydrogenase-like predicted oxidoreductase/MoaA/NifB/PqqE/SkfB family radical SAM enzyme